jgi:hypothetical protein
MSKVRSTQQQTGDFGERFVGVIVEKSGCWLTRNQDRDYGVDLEIELTEPKVAGEIVKLQVRSTETVSRNAGSIEAALPRTLVHLGENLRVPLLLVVFETSTERAWYLWVQRWWLQARQNGVRFDQLAETTTVWIPETQEFAPGLQGELKDIGRGQTREQLVLSLSDTVKAAIHHDDPFLLGPLTDLLAKLGPLPDPFPISLVIDRVVCLGGKIWATVEGNRESQLLFTLCRVFGDRFTVEQIDQLVWRGEGYSRTGINALDLLFTAFPDYIARLSLATRWTCRTDPRPAFYCAFRKAYPKDEIFCLVRPAFSFRSNGLYVTNMDEGTMLNHLANRGASALLDYLVLEV